METIDFEQPAPIPAPRKGWVAFLLSLVLPGLGHFYNGKISWAIVLFLTPYATVFAIAVTGLFRTFGGVIILVITFLCFRLLVCVHAVWLARKQKKYIRKTYNHWYYNLGVFVFFIAFNYFVFDGRSFLGIQGFRIPTPGNAPSLQVGDCIMSDMFWYTQHDPAYGDFAMYKREDGFYYTQRVIGLPGDEVFFDGDKLLINGKSCKQTAVGKLMLNEQFNATELEEILPNGKLYNIYHMDGFVPQNMFLTGRIRVPQNMVFLVGDNRHNSLDSRYIGFIPIDKLEGKVLYIYWADDLERIGVEF